MYIDNSADDDDDDDHDALELNVSIANITHRVWLVDRVFVWITQVLAGQRGACKILK